MAPIVERSFAAIDAVRSAGFDVAGHLTCVGQTTARRRRRDRTVCRTRRQPDRCAAGRSSGWCRSTLRAARRRVPANRRPRAQHQAARHLRCRGLGLPRAASAVVDGRSRPRRARREVRGRRRQGDHPDVLRQRALPPLSRPCPVARSADPDRARHLPDPLVPGRRPLRRSMWRVDTRTDRRPLRRPRRRPGDDHRRSRRSSPASRSPSSQRTASIRSTSTRSTVPSWPSRCARSSVSCRRWPRHERLRLASWRQRQIASSCSTARAAPSSRRSARPRTTCAAVASAITRSSLAGNHDLLVLTPTRRGRRAASVVPARRCRHHHAPTRSRAPRLLSASTASTTRH